MAEQTKRRRIFGPLTYGVLIASAFVYVGFRLEPWVHKQLRCGTLLSELRASSGSSIFEDKEREFSVLIDPSTSNWIDVAIKDKDARVRGLAYLLVPQAFPDPSQALPRLIRAASDPDPFVQLDALRSAVDLSRDMNKIDIEKFVNKTMKMLEHLLKNPDPSIRIGAFDRLTSLTHDGAALEETVASMIDDRLGVIRLCTIKNIGKFKTISSRLKRLLESRLEDRERSVRFAAAATLARFESERTRRIDPLRSAFRHPDISYDEQIGVGESGLNDEYNDALQSLMENLGVVETIDFFISMMRDSDPRVRVNGIEGLWFLGLNYQRFFARGSSSRSQPIDLTPDLFRTDRIAVLVSGLDDPDLRVAFEAAAALSSDIYSKYHNKYTTIDRVLRSVIANHDYSVNTRSMASSILIKHTTEWNEELERFFLKNLGINDLLIFRSLILSLSKRGMAGKPAIPLVVKLASRFPMQVESVRELLNNIDPSVGDKFFEESLRSNINESIEDEVPVENGDAPIPKS